MTHRHRFAVLRRTLFVTLALLVTGWAQAGQWVAGSYGNQYGSRGYKLWLPTGHAPGQAMPLVMVLHGCGSSAQKIADVTRFNELADREGIVVVYPEQTVWASLMLCWNWSGASSQTRDTGEPSILMGILGQAAASYGTDPRRQYVVGFSAGAGMAAILAACNADSFAAAAIHSGGMYKAATGFFEAGSAMSNGSSLDPDQIGIDAWKCSLSPRGRMPVIVIHGSDDPTVRPINGEQAARQFVQFNDLSDDGLDNGSTSITRVGVVQMPPAVAGGFPYTVKYYFNGDGDMVVQHVLVTGLDHHWSGGAATSGRTAEPYGPDATAMVWSFLRRQKR